MKRTKKEKIVSIKEALKQYLNDRTPDERYSSFDYCYNYFYSFYKERRLSELTNKKNRQMSCLQIGFYLASWGMMRGSSFLPGKSSRNYIPLIEVISKMSPELWEIDVENYNDKNIELLLNCKQQIKSVLGDENKPSDTLITKIMLGVFANVPAFDTYFRKGLGVHSCNEKSLEKIKEFYTKNKDGFNSVKKIHTLDFFTTKETNIIYTKAKLIDMYGFIKGQSR